MSNHLDDILELLDPRDIKGTELDLLDFETAKKLVRETGGGIRIYIPKKTAVLKTALEKYLKEQKSIANDKNAIRTIAMEIGCSSSFVEKIAKETRSKKNEISPSQLNLFDH